MVVTTFLPHSKEVLGFNLDHLVVTLVCSPCVGSLQALQPPPTVQRNAC